MNCQIALLVLAHITASLAESTHGHLGVDVAPTNVEVKGNGHQVARDAKAESKKSHGNIPLMKSEVVMVSEKNLGKEGIGGIRQDDTYQKSKAAWDDFKAPDYPCDWNVRIGKGPKQLEWRTMVVRGAEHDTFHFQGCTTQGEAALLCKRDKHNM